MLDRVFSRLTSIAGKFLRMRRNIRIWKKMTSGTLANPLPLASRDALATSLRRIETLAALLRAPSRRLPCEPLNGELVGEAAGMIADEVARMRAALNPHLSTRE